jgi:hypothetical protein
VQDLTVLPSLTLDDIARNIEFVDYEVNFPGSKTIFDVIIYIEVKTWWFE